MTTISSDIESTRRSAEPAVFVFLFAVLLLLWAPAEAHPHPSLYDTAILRSCDIPPGWWRGNTHTHSLWSDGDAAPEWIISWYKRSGYDFLVLSDHDVMQFGDKWVAVGGKSRLTEAHLQNLRDSFGADSLTLRGSGDTLQMRLKTLAELREAFEDADFQLVAGEELTDAFQGRELHVNGLNLVEPIPPQGGSSVREMINRNVDAILAQGERLQRPVLAHLNHPNRHWSVSWEDLAHIRNDRFFELYNGYKKARNGGDNKHPSMEEAWDRANHLRLTQLGLEPLYALAADDSHWYTRWGPESRNPGRGWIVVRSRSLSAESILAAMRGGDFYASTGVVLSAVEVTPRQYRVAVQAEPGVQYSIRFQGATSDDPRVTFQETSGPGGNYRFSGNELFVRATIVASKQQYNAPAGDTDTAWTQPVVVRRGGWFRL